MPNVLVLRFLVCDDAVAVAAEVASGPAWEGLIFADSWFLIAEILNNLLAAVALDDTDEERDLIFPGHL
jgi:hypothetical protein